MKIFPESRMTSLIFPETAKDKYTFDVNLEIIFKFCKECLSYAEMGNYGIQSLRWSAMERGNLIPQLN